MKLGDSKYLVTPVVKWFQQKLSLFTQYICNADKNQKHWNRDYKFGNWLATVWLTKLQTLETPVTIRLVKNPHPQL